jgi:hypothetical protein
MQCPNCNGFNSKEHYQHFKVPGELHEFDKLGAPIPQPCPINGCFAGIPTPPGTAKYNPVFTVCLDCGNVFW